MKRIVVALLSLGLAFGLAGCARAASAPAALGSAPVVAGGKTWKPITPGPNESKRMATLGPVLKVWADSESKSGRVPADLAGVSPILVGYRVEISTKQSDGKYTLADVLVTEGRVDQLGSPGVPLVAQNVPLIADQPTLPSEGVTPQSAGEKDAVAKALAWAKVAFPGKPWTAQIQGYELLYQLKGQSAFFFIPNAVSKGYMAVGGSTAK